MLPEKWFGLPKLLALFLLVRETLYAASDLLHQRDSITLDTCHVLGAERGVHSGLLLLLPGAEVQFQFVVLIVVFEWIGLLFLRHRIRLFWVCLLKVEGWFFLSGLHKFLVDALRSI